MAAVSTDVVAANDTNVNSVSAAVAPPHVRAVSELTIGMFTPIIADDHLRDVVQMLLMLADTPDCSLSCRFGSLKDTATQKRFAVLDGANMYRPSIVAVDITTIHNAQFDGTIEQKTFKFVLENVMQKRLQNEKQRIMLSPTQSVTIPSLRTECDRRALVALTYQSVADTSVRVCVTHDRRDMTGFISCQSDHTIRVWDFLSAIPESLDFRLSLNSAHPRPYPAPRSQWQLTSAQLLDQHTYTYHMWSLTLTQVNAFEGADALIQLTSDDANASGGETHYTIELRCVDRASICYYAQLMRQGQTSGLTALAVTLLDQMRTISRIVIPPPVHQNTGNKKRERDNTNLIAD